MASTAAALMIGSTLSPSSPPSAPACSSALDTAVTDQAKRDLRLSGENGITFAAGQGDALVEYARRHRVLPDARDDNTALVGGEEQAVMGVDPATIGQFYRFAWTDGSAQTPRVSGATVR